jgi:hypothetical protein
MFVVACTTRGMLDFVCVYNNIRRTVEQTYKKNEIFDRIIHCTVFRNLLLLIERASKLLNNFFAFITKSF